MTRVLVIDDDKAVGTAIKMVLEVAGFEVIHALDCTSGLAAIEKTDFQLIMIDLFMPGIDGLETIKACRRLDATVPIIAISGFMPRNGQDPAPDFLAMATKLGANRSLAKPFRPRELLRAVESCLAEAAKTSQLHATEASPAHQYDLR
ncbi:MAG TPA: response regulator [Xanthobacteraceae bacterium]|nr:response regulator [Xanthobacteraceae bacterium]